MPVTQLNSEPEILLLEARFPVAAQRLFEYWTQPTLLQAWWPPHAEIQARSGGSYHLSWPQMNWHLRGRYLTFEPAQELTFTWRWDHDHPANEKVVSLAFQPLDAGETCLRLSHGPYSTGQNEQDLRLNHHLAGWLHFLPRLEGLFS